MKTTFHNLLTLFSVLAAILLICLTVLMAAGLRPYILTSSSMEPTIAEGSLVFAHSVPLSSLKEGDAVVYRTNGLLVLHRYLGG